MYGQLAFLYENVNWLCGCCQLLCQFFAELMHVVMMTRFDMKANVSSV